eukprot:CAMPEP_0172669932 /NCGR_PEP_ID=MMETSP1074-20121228/9988_1 /TAXON_ID=2916 /ORGANISM="Ceratium fusus, Strain PA161109" /LENGTH=179 /DNA_ID=CAMNT_0013486777 /DNA_START=132 /DNA_END=672 /DNA_ORIENTATION=-
MHSVEPHHRIQYTASTSVESATTKAKRSLMVCCPEPADPPGRILRPWELRFENDCAEYARREDRPKNEPHQGQQSRVNATFFHTFFVASFGIRDPTPHQQAQAHNLRQSLELETALEHVWIAQLCKDPSQYHEGKRKRYGHDAVELKPQFEGACFTCATYVPCSHEEEQGYPEAQKWGE